MATLPGSKNRYKYDYSSGNAQLPNLYQKYYTFFYLPQTKLLRQKNSKVFQYIAFQFHPQFKPLPVIGNR